MSLILEVLSGPKRGATLRLAPGQFVRVGRTSNADAVFPDDSHMSGSHFGVECLQDGFLVRDLGSSNGTLLNGQRIMESPLQVGDLIVAGETHFLFRKEPSDTAPLEADRKPAAETTPQDRLLQLFRNDFQPLYAILDGARDIRILALLLNCKKEDTVQSLYEGPQGDKLAQVAPYLVRLQEDSPLLEVLVKEGWGKSWGVYLTSVSEFQGIRRHLRRFLEVKLPSGEPVYFRFYDPRVLPVFLPTCTPTEATEFFGPIHCYLVEDESPEQLLRFVNTVDGSEKIAIPLHDRKVPEPGASPDGGKPGITMRQSPLTEEAK